MGSRCFSPSPDESLAPAGGHVKNHRSYLRDLLPIENVWQLCQAGACFWLFLQRALKMTDSTSLGDSAGRSFGDGPFSPPSPLCREHLTTPSCKLWVKSSTFLVLHYEKYLKPDLLHQTTLVVLCYFLKTHFGEITPICVAFYRAK